MSPKPHFEIPRALLSNILDLCDCLVGQAGRTTLVLGLRGSKSKKAMQFNLHKARGYGCLADRTQEEVLAIVDQLIEEGILELNYYHDLPLIYYSQRGLELADGFLREHWLSLLRTQVSAAAAGKAVELPFLYAKMPERNNHTVAQLISAVEEEADVNWVPLLRLWQAQETRRMRGPLQRIIETLESKSSRA